MPAKFLKCAKEGGRVRTVCHQDKCVKVCYQGQKSVAGHAFTRKGKSKTNKIQKK